MARRRSPTLMPPTLPISFAARRRVVLLGFSDFERQALWSFFRLAGKRFGGGVAAQYRAGRDIERADFIIADADHDASVRTLVESGRARDTVFIGSRRPDGAGAWLARPIVPTRLLRELDALAALREMLAVDGDGDANVVSPAGAATTPVDIELAPGNARPRRALLAESEPGALATVQARLQALGYAIETAASGEEALAAVEAQQPGIVFIDAAIGSAGALDGFEVCQRLRRQPPRSAPVVVIVGGRGGEGDRVRASLAGSDAYLPLPLQHDSLDAALHYLGPALSGAEALSGDGRR